MPHIFMIVKRKIGQEISQSQTLLGNLWSLQQDQPDLTIHSQ
jgi:hypothetical protein